MEIAVMGNTNVNFLLKGGEKKKAQKGFFLDVPQAGVCGDFCSLQVCDRHRHKKYDRT